MDQSKPKIIQKFKVIVIGDSGVGKSHLIKRFRTGEVEFDEKSTFNV